MKRIHSFALPALPAALHAAGALGILVARAPALVWLAAAALGWIGVDTALSDPWLAGWIAQKSPTWLAADPACVRALGTAFVLIAAVAVRGLETRPHTSESEKPKRI